MALSLYPYPPSEILTIYVCLSALQYRLSHIERINFKEGLIFSFPIIFMVKKIPGTKTSSLQQHILKFISFIWDTLQYTIYWYSFSTFNSISSKSPTKERNTILVCTFYMVKICYCMQYSHMYSITIIIPTLSRIVIVILYGAGCVRTLSISP